MQGIGSVNYMTTDQIKEYSLYDFNLIGPNGIAMDTE